MTSVLISRFLLHLQAVNRTASAIATSGSISGSAMPADSLIFARVADSFAASIEHSDLDYDMEEDVEHPVRAVVGSEEGGVNGDLLIFGCEDGEC